MGPSDRIDLHSNVQAFFEEIVEIALRESGHRASTASALYLASVLADFGMPGDRQHVVLRQPMTLLLSQALTAPPAERFERLRGLGDGVLTLAGFFGDHLETRGIERDYAAQVGSRAYDAAATLLRQAGGKTVGPAIFDELSSGFDRFIEVVGGVADELSTRGAHRDRDVLGVYERWTRTGSVRLAQALVEWGLTPQKGDGTVH